VRQSKNQTDETVSEMTTRDGNGARMAKGPK
jgi:hypothetical protein